MRDLRDLDGCRIAHPRTADMGDEFNGMFRIRLGSQVFIALASNGLGWDHVSVSNKKRQPTWDEMCRIKALFFADDDVVVQFHPAKQHYVNVHPNCLHLWRWQQGDFPQPSIWLV